jgi:hypothetical protein
MHTQNQRRSSALSAALALAGCNDADVSPGVSVSESAESGDATTGMPTTTDASTTFDTLMTGGGSGDTAGLAADIDCADPPPAAVGAEYDHQLQLVDDHGVSWTWSVTGLPDGMALAPLTGRLTGAPTEEGSFDIEVSVTNPDGAGMGTCTIDVAAQLAVDFDALGAPCITPDVDLEDFITGGDGSPLRCTTSGGSGEGRIPDGITVDPDSCVAQGTTDDTYGTWAWITQVEQSGLRMPVPFCWTIDEQAPGAYTIVGNHSGGMDNALEPAVRTFVPGDPIAFGGGGDPIFYVTQDTPLNPIHFHFSFNVAASPFGDCGVADCYGLDPTDIVMNMAGERIGFSHELFALGGPLDDAFADRPWVFTVRTFYCIADNTVDCNNDNYLANGNGELRFSAIFFPE